MHTFSFPFLLDFCSHIYMEKHAKNISTPHYRYLLEIWPQMHWIKNYSGGRMKEEA